MCMPHWTMIAFHIMLYKFMSSRDASDYTQFSILSAFSVLTFSTMIVENAAILFPGCSFPCFFTPELFETKKKSKFNIIQKFVTLIHILSVDMFGNQCWSIWEDNGRTLKHVNSCDATSFISHPINWIQSNYEWWNRWHGTDDAKYNGLHHAPPVMIQSRCENSFDYLRSTVEQCPFAQMYTKEWRSVLHE